MLFTWWFLVIGLLLVAMAVLGSYVERLPLSSALLYLAAGFGLGPAGLGLIDIDPLRAAAFLERFAEVAVLVSLFAAGLKLRVPPGDPLWWVPVRLAVVAMALTVGLIAAAGYWGLGLSAGAAVLLGGILAPTDPVLASDVQVAEPTDRDRLRFALTGEAGLNDGTAFPFVMLGLGLLGLHDLGAGGGRFLVVDVLWAVAAGLGVGWALGELVARLVLHLRRAHREAVGLDDFLALGLICLAYGVALLIHAYGFLAVFAAGLALRRVEREQARGEDPPEDVRDAAGRDPELATHPEKAPAYMAGAVLGFTEQLGRILEVGVVLLIGGTLARLAPPRDAWWFVPLVLLAIRPASVLLGLVGARATALQLGLMGWFGIRGIGSIYYLMHAIGHGLAPDVARPLVDLTLTVVAASIVVHGVSVTPLMRRYRERSEAARGRRPA
jgi:NhaP-type Na+/H+ or K+/H+ antiporter